MRTKTILLVMATLVFMLVSNAMAADDIVTTVAKGCELELTSYCSEITPGEGRVLACLYAHSAFNAVMHHLDIMAGTGRAIDNSAPVFSAGFKNFTYHLKRECI